MLFLCLFPLLGMAQIVNPPITRADKELKGEVKTMVERTYDVYRGELKQKRLLPKIVMCLTKWDPLRTLNSVIVVTACVTSMCMILHNILWR